MSIRLPLLARFHRALICAAAAITAACSLPAQTTYRDITLDCGGWFSGFAQAEDSRIYGFGDVFGAWRSDDAGNTWRYLNWGIPEFSIFGQAIAVQRNNANVVFYQTDVALYKSTDGGSTWSKKLGDLGIGDNGAPVYRGASPILIRSNNPNEIWLAAPRKNMTGTLWVSSDGGDSWAKAGGTDFDTNPAITLHNIPGYPNQIWVGSVGGLFVSTNGSSPFTRIGSASSLANVGMISRFPSGTHAGVGLVTRSNNNGGGISRITATDFNNVATYTITDSTTSSLQFGYPTGLQIFSDGTSSAWNTSADRHGFSSDGGQSFTVRGTTLNTTNVPIWTTAARMQATGHPDYGSDQVIETIGNPNKWLITGGGAPMVSLDKGLSWQYLANSNGLAGVKTWVASTSRFSTNVMYVPSADIGSAIITDGGSSGIAAFSSAKSFNFLHGAQKVMEGPDSQNLLIAGVEQSVNRSALIRSTNGGSTWVQLNLAGTGLPESYEGITKSVMSLNNANDFLVVLGRGIDLPSNPGVWRSTNGGASFTPVTGLPSNLVTGARYNSQSCFIDRDATNANLRYFVARDITLYRSTDGGSSWTPAVHPFPNGASFDWAWAFMADPVRSNNLWAAGQWRGVAVSRDGGLSWNQTAQYFDARFVSSCDGKIAVYGKAQGDTVNRFYYSTSDGASFTAITDSTKNFDGLQGITVDRTGRIWVSFNSITIITPPAAAISPPSITSSLSATAPQNSFFNYTIVATNSPTGYSASGLPAGLSLNTSNGVISGTPTASGTSNVSISATNGGGTDTETLVLTVNAASGGGGGSAGLTREYWTGIGGGTITDLTANSAYPNSPTGQDVISTMRATNWSSSSVSSNWGDSFGQRIRGFITAPATGSYTFWISGDDHVELWLSTNDSAASRVRIAHHTDWTGVDEWNKFTTQRSAAISLVSGQRYYVEVLHKEGSGGDSVSVGWRKPSDGVGTTPVEIVPNSVLTTLNSTATATPVISSALTRSITVGTAMSAYTITASNRPTSYGATNLPAGLSVNTSTGVISGTPTTAGTVNTTISATNSGGTGSATLVFTIGTTSNTVNRATGGTATTSSTNSPANESVAQAFDGNTGTKWLTFASSGWIRYAFGGGASWNITRYAITSANDAPERDPRNWTLQGSNNGTSWTTVDTRSAQTFSARFQRREFTVTTPGTYSFYRLNITANQSGTTLQLAELQLY